MIQQSIGLLAFLHTILKIANPKITIPKIANGVITNNFAFNPMINRFEGPNLD